MAAELYRWAVTRRPNAAVAEAAYGDRPMTRILLVRHGESEWNAARRWQGQADPPLTDRGRLQAAHAATAIGTVDVDRHVRPQTSAGTAQIIADALGLDAASWSTRDCVSATPANGRA